MDELYLENLEEQVERLKKQNKKLKDRIKAAKEYANTNLETYGVSHLLNILDGKEIKLIKT